MTSIAYVHWDADEANAVATKLRALGHRVHVHASRDASMKLGGSLPDVLVISLARLPSHGRQIALWFQETKARREIPIVFCGGAKDKIVATRKKFPAAIYSTERALAGAIDRALSRPVAAKPVAAAAKTPTAGYSGTPLWKKLGIADGHRVAALDAPAPLVAALADAVPTALFVATLGRGPALDVVLLFVRSRAELVKKLDRAIERLADRGGLWIAWPKRTSGIATDLVEDVLREVILPTGLVDNKVCAIDDTWSGLRFVRRVAKR